MRRSAFALGASVVALALTAGPAAAEPQSIGDSVAAAQVGAVTVDAPIRVASDGDDAAPASGGGAPQVTSESAGTAQASSVHANAPVRVLSEGESGSAGVSGSDAAPQSTDDSLGAAQVGSAGVDAPVRVASDGGSGGDAEPSSAAGEQDATETTGSAQVGSAGAEAPVRVLSDGGDAGSGAAGRTGGEQTVDGTSGAAQAGAPGLFAPVRVLSDTGSPAGEPDAWDSAGDLVGLIADADGSQGATPIGSQAPGDAPEGVRRLADSGGTAPGTRPALQLVTGGDGPITGVQDTGAGGLQTLGVQAGSLPLTGFALPALVALGMWLLSSGLALRLVPGGKRR